MQTNDYNSSNAIFPYCTDYITDQQGNVKSRLSKNNQFEPFFFLKKWTLLGITLAMPYKIF